MRLGGYSVLIVEVFFIVWCSELEQVLANIQAVGIFNFKAFNGRNGTKEGRGDVGTGTYNASPAKSVRVARDVSTIKFFLYVGKYTGIEDGRQVFRGHKPHLLQSGFIRDAPTKIICHGYASSYREGPGELLVPAYLKAWEGRALNVISIDWSQMSSILGKNSEGKIRLNGLYTFPAGNTEHAGHTVGALIEFLVNELGMDLDKFHLIGHSLGAHVMGYAARYLKTKKLGPVGRITALDPAGPCYERFRFICFNGDYNPISRWDAAFVDVIHTNAQLLGMKKPVGDVDFYPNGGYNQPRCTEDVSVDILYLLAGQVGKFISGIPVGMCSHTRAIELMRESILNNGRGIRAHRCLDETAWKTGRCSSSANELAFLGEPCSPSSRGIYVVQTDPESSELSKALSLIQQVLPVGPLVKPPASQFISLFGKLFRNFLK